MSVQTTYDFAPAKGFEGQIASADGDFCVTPGLQNEATASIAHGRAVKYYSTNSDDGVRLPTAGADVIKGIVVHSHAIGYLAMDTNGDVKPGEVVNVLRRGRVWVICENGCTPGQPVHVRFAGVGNAGALLSAADGSNTTLVRGTWESTAAAGALALVAVDFGA